MSSTALTDLLAALALMFVGEGLVFAVFSRRLPRLLEQMQAMPPEQVRWAGLAMAIVGTLLYLGVRT